MADPFSDFAGGSNPFKDDLQQLGFEPLQTTAAEESAALSKVRRSLHPKNPTPVWDLHFQNPTPV